MGENIKLVADTIADINKDNIKQILIDLRLKTQTSEDVKNLVINKSDLVSVLDLVNRNDNIICVLDHMLKIAGIDIECSDCDYSQGCSLNPGKVNNCKDIMKENIARWK